MQQGTTASDIVQKYIDTACKVPDGTPDSFSQYKAELDELEKALASRPDEERFSAFVWLINEKHEARDEHNKAGVEDLEACQKVLEDHLYPHRKDELYIALGKFLAQEQGMTEEDVAWAYEETLSNLLKLNNGEPALEVQAIIETIKSVGGKKAVEQFIRQYL